MSNVKAAGILGMGRALPTDIRRNEDWPSGFVETMMRKEKKGEADPYRGVTGGASSQQHFDPIVAKHMSRFAQDPFRGAVERRMIGPDELPSNYAIAAAKEAIERSGVDPQDIDFLMMHAMVSDDMFPPPGDECHIHKQLGLSEDGAAWRIDSICSSFTTQLTLARSMIMQGMAKNVVCINSCMYSRWTDYTDTTSLYNGDGVAAAVVGPVPEGYGIQGWHFRTRGEHKGGIKTVFRSPHMGRNGETDLPPQLLVEMGPKEVQFNVMADLIPQVRHCAKMATERAGITIKDLSLVITHQPTAWFHYAALEALELPESMAFETFAKYANLSSACLPVNMYEALEAGRAKKGDWVLLFGPHAGYGYQATVTRLV